MGVGAIAFIFMLAGICILSGVVKIGEGELVGISGFVFAGIVIFPYLFYRRERKKDEEFLMWIVDNMDELYEGKQIYYAVRGIDLDVDVNTELVFYQYVYSLFLWVGIRALESRYFIVGHHDKLKCNLFYGFHSLFYGWYGLPMSPFYIVKAINKNIRGGEMISIHTIIVDLLKEVVEKEDRLPELLTQLKRNSMVRMVESKPKKV